MILAHRRHVKSDVIQKSKLSTDGYQDMSTVDLTVNLSLQREVRYNTRNLIG